MLDSEKESSTSCTRITSRHFWKVGVQHGPGRRSTRVMLHHARVTLAAMYLQRGPPIAENKSTTHRTHRTPQKHDFYPRSLHQWTCRRLGLTTCCEYASLLPTLSMEMLNLSLVLYHCFFLCIIIWKSLSRCYSDHESCDLTLELCQDPSFAHC
jgi:hypothetical protein